MGAAAADLRDLQCDAHQLHQTWVVRDLVKRGLSQGASSGLLGCSLWQRTPGSGLPPRQPQRMPALWSPAGRPHPWRLPPAWRCLARPAAETLHLLKRRWQGTDETAGHGLSCPLQPTYHPSALRLGRRVDHAARKALQSTLETCRPIHPNYAGPGVSNARTTLQRCRL